MSEYPRLRLYIGGEWRESRDTQPVLNPADESMIGAVPLATQADLDQALSEAAAEGLTVWRRTAPGRRADVLLKAAALMRGRVDDIAVLHHLRARQAARPGAGRSRLAAANLRLGRRPKASAPTGRLIPARARMSFR